MHKYQHYLNKRTRAIAYGFTEKGMSFREVLLIGFGGVAYIFFMWHIV